MTGGIGFAKQGQAADKYNRSLLNVRPKKIAAQSSVPEREGTENISPNLAEIQAWKSGKSKNENALTLWIYCILLLLASLLCLAFLLF